jgi:hypothetical protein
LIFPRRKFRNDGRACPGLFACPGRGRGFLHADRIGFEACRTRRVVRLRQREHLGIAQWRVAISEAISEPHRAGRSEEIQCVGPRPWRRPMLISLPFAVWNSHRQLELAAVGIGQDRRLRDSSRARHSIRPLIFLAGIAYAWRHLFFLGRGDCRRRYTRRVNSQAGKSAVHSKVKRKNSENNSAPVSPPLSQTKTTTACAILFVEFPASRKEPRFDPAPEASD